MASFDLRLLFECSLSSEKVRLPIKCGFYTRLYGTPLFAHSSFNYHSITFHSVTFHSVTFPSLLIGLAKGEDQPTGAITFLYPTGANRSIANVTYVGLLGPLHSYRCCHIFLPSRGGRTPSKFEKFLWTPAVMQATRGRWAIETAGCHGDEAKTYGAETRKGSCLYFPRQHIWITEEHQTIWWTST